MKMRKLLRGALAFCLPGLVTAGGCTASGPAPVVDDAYWETLPIESSGAPVGEAPAGEPEPCLSGPSCWHPEAPSGTAHYWPVGEDLKETKIVPDQGAPMYHFGSSIAISGDTLIVGEPDDSLEGANAGSAYIFVKSGGAWVQQARLSASDAEVADYFGFSVAIEGDTAVVGAYLSHESNGSPGAVYVFEREGSTWTEQAKLVEGGESVSLFGSTVAISGTTVAVGAMQGNDKTGAVYVFEREGPGWVEEAKLLASDGKFGDALGISVSIDGDTILAGAASAKCELGKYCGAAYIFQRHDSKWTEQAKLTAGDPEIFNFFGRTVSLAGNVAVAGTYLHSNPDGSRGTAYVFEREGEAWVERARLASADAGPADQFGISVSAFGSRVVVGSCMSPEGGQRPGAAYVFSKGEGEWVQERRIVASDGVEGDSFGCWVASSKDTIAVSSYKSDPQGVESGAAYVFQGPSGLLSGDARKSD